MSRKFSTGTPPSVLVLGSASPRRRRILTELGIAFEVLTPEADEVLHVDDPARTVTENALLKNAWCRAHRSGRRILTADTVLDFEGRCVGKPGSLEEAAALFRALSGQTHHVLTAVALSAPGTETAVEVVTSAVTFRPLTDSSIDDYFARVDPLDKAGGYDIDEHGERIIESHSGSRTNIMGLPCEVVTAWLIR